MSTANFPRYPVVSVVHFDVGPNRSISIEDFLRSLKRVPNRFSSNCRAQKGWRLNAGEQRLQAQPTLGESLLPALDDYTPTDCLAQLLDAEAPPECGECSVNEAVKLTKEVQPLRSISQRPRVRKVYTRKHKCVAPAVFASELRPPASLRSGHENNSDEALPEDPPIVDQAASSSPCRSPRSFTRELPQGKKTSRTSSTGEKANGPAKRPRRHAPMNELPLVDLLAGLSSPKSEIAYGNSNPKELAADPIETWGQAEGTPRRSNDQHANGKRRSVTKPLSSIQKSLRLSKDNSIDPREFRLPPQTPANTQPTTWKLGSGFKKREKPNVGKKNNTLPAKEKPTNLTSPQQQRPEKDSDMDQAREVTCLINREAPQFTSSQDNARPTSFMQHAPHQGVESEDHQPTDRFRTPDELESQSTQPIQETRLDGGDHVMTNIDPSASVQPFHEEHSGETRSFAAVPVPKPKRTMRHLQGRRQLDPHSTVSTFGAMGIEVSIIPPEIWPRTSAPQIMQQGEQTSLPAVAPDTGDYFS